MLNLNKHIGVALFYFLLVSLMGILLRFYFVTSLPFNYKYLLHAHSHTALVGWVYLGLTTLIYKIFLQSAEKPKIYQRIFYFTNICIVGMIIFFPIQGYALYSIIFSTLFLFASYWFAWFAIKFVPQHFKKRFSWRLVKTSIWYLVISSIGPWGIGAIMSTLGPASIWYKSSIYFYLHFQYNGWFILSLLGIVFYFLEEKKVEFDRAKLKSFFLLINFGIIFTLFLSVLWFEPPKIIYILGGIGAVVQILAFHDLYYLLKKHFQLFKQEFNTWGRILIKMATVLMGVKLIMQLVSAHPYFARLAFQLKDFVIGYLHLVFLGVVISALMAFLQYYKLLKISKGFLWIFLFAFASTEILIFYKGIVLWMGAFFFTDYYLVLAVLSCLFPLAIGKLFMENITNNSKAIEEESKL